MILQEFLDSFSEMCEEKNAKSARIGQLRNAIETVYVHYKKEEELAHKDKSRFVDEYGGYEEEEHFYQWRYYPYDMVRTIFTQTGWKLDEAFCDVKAEFNLDGDVFFYKIDFFDVFDTIVRHSNENQESDITFLYCILILIKGIDSQRELYRKFAEYVRNAINEYGFKDFTDAVYDGGRQIFVAMSFKDDMRQARNSIRKAITDNGFRPVFIDEKEHSNFIVPEILMEIERSAFVVADLTHQRGGVYYEAGYAHALKIPVIMTCRGDDFKHIHFDIKQINTIKWENVDELQDKLSKRIIALNRN